MRELIGFEALEAAGSHLGGIWDTSGDIWRHLGGIWRHQRGIWQAFGGTWEAGELPWGLPGWGNMPRGRWKTPSAGAHSTTSQQDTNIPIKQPACCKQANSKNARLQAYMEYMECKTASLHGIHWNVILQAWWKTRNLQNCNLRRHCFTAWWPTRGRRIYICIFMYSYI